MALRQTMICTDDQNHFIRFVTSHLEDGWKVIPETLVCEKVSIVPAHRYYPQMETTYICFFEKHVEASG